jgi:hypothetical protein
MTTLVHSLNSSLFPTCIHPPTHLDDALHLLRVVSADFHQISILPALECLF